MVRLMSASARRLVISSRAEARLEAARTWLAGLPADAEVLVLAPHAHAAAELVRSVVERHGSRFGIQRLTLDRLAAMLAAPLPGGQATVTVCHTRTPDLGAHTRRADIVVVAAGVRGLLKPGQVRPDAIVVDVGTHPVPAAEGGWTLAGDVDPEVAAVAGWLTPVPGGVGPVTNAVLMRHVTAAAVPGYLAPAW